MHSKWKVWDFFTDTSRVDYRTGLLCVSLFDPVIRHQVQSFIIEAASLEGIHYLSAKDITSEWIEDNLKSLSLFGGGESFVISDAESLNPTIKEELLNNDFDSNLILFFNKTDSSFTKFTKKKEGQSLGIQGPAFWEFDLLLDFICSQEKVLLDHDVKQMILEYVPHSVIDFSNIVQRLKLNYGGESISKAMAEELIDKSRIDNFEFATLFGFKKRQDFYQKLIDLKPSFDEMRSLFYFLQTHLMKMSSVDNIYAKAKKTKYDQQIISQAKLWSPKEISMGLNFLKSIEIDSKLKKPLMYNDIASLYLRSIF